MKLKTSLMLLLVSIITPATLWSQDAKEIVRKADTKYNGEKSSYSEMTMTIVRPKYKRNIELKGWAESGGQALTLITAPAKEKGQTFLKSGNNLWSWNPTIQRLIKLPPSMMSQGWMGSDFSNDDILKESSLVKDYKHNLIGTETVGGMNCYKIELILHILIINTIIYFRCGFENKRICLNSHIPCVNNLNLKARTRYYFTK